MGTIKENIAISIVTVGMNHLNYMKDFLKSVFITHPPKVDFELIYIDNCSSDGSVDFIKKNYPAIIIIENQTPLGFGENNNLGVAHANGEYIAILNPDIVLLENALDDLYYYLSSQEKDLILAPKLLNHDKSIQNSVREFMTLYVFIMRFFSKGNDNTNNKKIRNYLYKDIDYDQIQFVDWAIGAALFMRKKHFEKLNGFDKDYFLYFEDVDLCYRSWELNFPVVYYPKSQMVHNHLRASTKFNKKTIMHFKSMFIFFKKHGYFISKKYNKLNH